MTKKIFNGKIEKLTEFHARVSVMKLIPHPKYRKYLKQYLNFRVKLSNKKEYKIGDYINFYMDKPSSKTVFCYEQV